MTITPIFYLDYFVDQPFVINRNKRSQWLFLQIEVF